MESRESSQGFSSFSTQQQTGLGGSGWEGKVNQPNLPQVEEVICSVLQQQPPAPHADPKTLLKSR